MKKVIALIIIMTLLTGCSINVVPPESDDNNTISNIKTTVTETETSTEIPPADPVASLDSLSAKKVVWGYGSVKNHQKPSEPLSLDEKYKSLGAKWFIDGEKRICLTFDEGYENGYTPKILDVLKEKNVKAVFFVTYDFVKDNEALVKRMIDEGHIVGNHSYRHYSMDELDTDTAREEVTFLHNYVKEKFNYTMSYFRFPKGEFSEKTLGILKELNYESIFWSYAYADWDPDEQPAEDKAFTDLCEAAHPGEILLLHAVSKTNANILGKVIDDIHKQGYEFSVEL